MWDVDGKEVMSFERVWCVFVVVVVFIVVCLGVFLLFFLRGFLL